MSRLPDPHAKFGLLRAAEEVFAERGLVGAKVEDITRRAGLSKGAFYLHFESKEAALKQVVEAFLARCGSHVPAPDDSPEIDALDAEALAAHWLATDLATYEFLWKNRAIVRILGSCQGDYAYLVDTFRSEMQRTAERWVSFWQAHGFFRDDVDVELVATLMCGAHNELVQRMLTAPRRPDLEAWVRETQALFVRGAGTRAFRAAVHERNQRVTEDIERAAGPRRAREGARP